MTLQILNRLGPLYNGYSGIYPEQNGKCSGIYSPDDEEIIQEALDNHLDVLAEDDSPIKTVEEASETGCVTIFYDYNEIKKNLNVPVNYKKVVIKFTGGHWYNLPKKWYNMVNPKTRDRSDRKYRLKQIWTRKYITVDNPFWEVSIDANKKGSPITIDDVLFATRALMADHTRTINGGYKVIQETNDMLVLEPDIDNFST